MAADTPSSSRPGSDETRKTAFIWIKLRDLLRSGHSSSSDAQRSPLGLALRLVRWLAATARAAASKVMAIGLIRRIVVARRAAGPAAAAPSPAVRLYRSRPPMRVLRPWTQEDALNLLAVARAEQGTFHVSGILRSAFWEAFILAGNDTGLRIDDLLQLRREQIQPDGSFSVVSIKTGRAVQCRLRPETVAAIDSTHPLERTFIFDLTVSRRCFEHLLRRLCKSAGLPGTIRWRRRMASSVEGGAA